MAHEIHIHVHLSGAPDDVEVHEPPVVARERHQDDRDPGDFFWAEVPDSLRNLPWLSEGLMLPPQVFDNMLWSLGYDEWRDVHHRPPDGPSPNPTRYGLPQGMRTNSCEDARRHWMFAAQNLAKLVLEEGKGVVLAPDLTQLARRILEEPEIKLPEKFQGKTQPQEPEENDDDR